MRLLPVILRRMLCRHEFENEKGLGFENVGGWLVPVTVRVCEKCGKMKRV